MGERKYYSQLIGAWSDYFSGSGFRSISEVKNEQITLEGDTFVQFCVFVSLVDSIQLNTHIAVRLCVEDSAFSNCSSDLNGGAIQFISNFGECVLERVCGHYCFTTTESSGQFVSIIVMNDASAKNHVLFTTYHECSPFSFDEYMISSSISIERGEILLRNCNSSHNKCYQNSGLDLQESSGSFSVSQSQFFNNTATHSICIALRTGNPSLGLCNFILNNQNMEADAIIYTHCDSATFARCFFELNQGCHCLFTAMLGPIQIIDSHIQSGYSTEGDVQITGTPIDYYTHYYQHHQTIFCDPAYHPFQSIQDCLTLSKTTSLLKMSVLVILFQFYITSIC